MLCITYNFHLIIHNYYYKFYNCYQKLHNIIVLYKTFNFDHRSVTECNRKIVTILKIFRRCPWYFDWKNLNLCWLVQFYCSEDKFTMLLRFSCSLSIHTNTHIYANEEYIYKWICIDTYNNYTNYTYLMNTINFCIYIVLNIFHLKCIFSLKKQIAVSFIIFCEWMPLKKPTRWVSEGCPLSTEWEVIERGFGGCARARGRIWRVSLGRVPPSKATLTLSPFFLLCSLSSFHLVPSLFLPFFYYFPIFYFIPLFFLPFHFPLVLLAPSSDSFLFLPYSDLSI